MSEDNIQKALGRIEGKLEMILSTSRQQGEHLLRLQELKLDITEKDKIMMDSAEVKRVIHHELEKQSDRTSRLEKIGFIGIGLVLALEIIIGIFAKAT